MCVWCECVCEYAWCVHGVSVHSECAWCVRVCANARTVCVGMRVWTCACFECRLNFTCT